MERLSDNYYVEKIRSGEIDCFAPLLERYSKQVFSLIVKIVGNREDAEELTQDVFMKAFRSLSSFRGASSFSTWIYRIAYNTAISAARKQMQEYVSVDDEILANVPDGSSGETMTDGYDGIMKDEVDPDVRVDYLNRALGRLRPDDRAMILLFYTDNQSMEAIAAMMGLTETNVKTKMFRIRKKLFGWIQAMEEEKI